jgi:LmbE family N-acetylglucosaminyl deacetylase
MIAQLGVLTAMKKSYFFTLQFLVLLLFSSNSVWSQQVSQNNGGVMPSASILQSLKKLQVLGSVLYIAAHPDDENNSLLPYLAKEKMYRTAYLSLTRGDGGQNLIGPEQGIELGMIRTKELLAAREIDGAEQYFTSAYEFGFSKSMDEALQVWDRQKVLADAVWVIRNYKPDVIIARFPPDARAGHGHHSASAQIAREAFAAAADPHQFPEQLTNGVTVWQAKRLLWNTFNFGGANTTSNDQFKIDVGVYNPLEGKSYGEIGGEARSMHKSQGEGRPRRKGEILEYFTTIVGEAPTRSLLDGVSTDWKRLGQNGASIATAIEAVIVSYNPLQPALSLPALVKIYEQVKGLPTSVWRSYKLNTLQQIIEAAAGLSVEAYTVSEKAVQGDSISFTCAVNNRSTAVVRLENIAVSNQAFTKQVDQQLIQNKNYNYVVNMLPVVSKNDFQPYWLQQSKKTDGMFLVNDYRVLGKAWNDPTISVQFTCTIEGVVFTITRPVLQKYVDLVKGECVQPFIIIPPYELVVKPTVVLTNVLSEKDKKNISTPLQLTVLSNQEKQMSASVRYTLMDQKTGKQVYEKGVDSVFKDAKSSAIAVPLTSFYNPATVSNSVIASVEVTNNKGTQHYNEHLQKIVYDHIPNTHYLTQDIVKVVDEPIRVKGSKVGYIAGSGDLTEEALVQLGYRVEKITAANCTPQYLAGFDAIVTGVRAYNVNAFLKDGYQTLLQYVQNGGNLIVQYNRTGTNGLTPPMAPYPFTISGGSRVTEENAEVVFSIPAHPVLQTPNQITARDFEGWIQERSTYQATAIDARYQAPLLMHDKNEQPSSGSLITCAYGKGNFSYVGLALFRQLPAGVSGAYKLLANLIALPKH